MRHHKTLTWNDRLKIEALLKAKTPKKDIARIIGVHISTIYLEIKRGSYEHLNSDYTTEIRYSPDISEKKKQAFLRAKGAPLKIGKDYDFANYLEYKIVKEKYSPRAVLGEIKRKGMKFDTSISVPTFYRYIEQGVFLTLSNDDYLLRETRVNRSTGKYPARHVLRKERVLKSAQLR